MSRLEKAAVACFVLGAGLLFPFEETLTILSGVLFLVAFVVSVCSCLPAPRRWLASRTTAERPAARRPYFNSRS